jgi:hypothetical protein
MITDINRAAEVIAAAACNHIRITNAVFEGNRDDAFRWAKDRALNLIISTLDGDWIDDDITDAADCFDRELGPVAGMALRGAINRQLAGIGHLTD